MEMKMKKLLLMTIALVTLTSAVHAGDASEFLLTLNCDQLWFGRNAVFKERAIASRHRARSACLAMQAADTTTSMPCLYLCQTAILLRLSVRQSGSYIARCDEKAKRSGTPRPQA
jgi:hypothetical protein